MKKIIMISALSALTLSACATPRAYNRIDTEARSSITNTEGILVVKQGEIGSDVIASDWALMKRVIGTNDLLGAAARGLVFSLIDSEINSSRTTKAEEAMGPIRDMLLDYDFAATLEKEMEREFSDAGIAGLSDMTLIRAEDTDYRQTKLEQSTADSVLFIDASYKMSANFDMIVFTADVKVFPVNAALTAFKEKPNENKNLVETKDNIYRNVFQSSAPLDLVADMKTNAADAAKLPAQDFITAFDSAAKLLAAKIASDLLVDDS